VRRALLPLALAALLATGCGNARTRPPDLTAIAKPGSFRTALFRRSGIRLRIPVTWTRMSATAPEAATISSGDAQIALWRYPRAEPLPQSVADLRAARTNLLAAVRTRDPAFMLESSRIVVKPGYRAVELIGTGHDDGVERGIRSLHAYGRGAEVVVDALAPPKDFARVNLAVFGPVTRSLQLRAPR
jgi:hypothetical protein